MKDKPQLWPSAIHIHIQLFLTCSHIGVLSHDAYAIKTTIYNIEGSTQDCGNSDALAMVLQQSWAKS